MQQYDGMTTITTAKDSIYQARKKGFQPKLMTACFPETLTRLVCQCRHAARTTSSFKGRACASQDWSANNKYKYRFEACSSCPDVPQLSGSPKMVNAHALRVVRVTFGLRIRPPNRHIYLKLLRTRVRARARGRSGSRRIPALFPADLRSADSWVFCRC